MRPSHELIYFECLFPPRVTGILTGNPPKRQASLAPDQVIQDNSQSKGGTCHRIEPGENYTWRERYLQPDDDVTYAV
jgi:hypothetical protein